MEVSKEDWKKFVLKDNEMEFRLLDLGKVAPYVDNTYEFLETGRKQKLRRREFFGLEFVLVSNTIYEVELEIEVHFPDGTDERTTMKIKNNVPQMICQGFLHEYHMMDGKWMLRVEVKDRIYAENGEEISVYGGLQEEFKIKCIKPETRLATDDDIHNVEVMYNTQLNDDYKTFLKEHNGYNFQWWLHNDLGEHMKMVGAKELRKAAKLPSDKKDKEWIDEVNELFGVNTEKYEDLIPSSGKPYNHFYDVAFGRFFYPIGTDGGGNPMVQIAVGKNKGKLGMIDHEVFYGGMDCLANPDEYEDVEEPPFGKLATADADAVIDYCEEAGFLAIFEELFSDYFTGRKAIIEEKKTLAKNALQYMIPTEDGDDPLAALNNMDFDVVDIKKMGGYNQDGADFKLKEKGKKIKLGNADLVGIQFKVKSSKETSHLARCTVTTPNGDNEFQDINASSNELTTFSVACEEKGEYAFKVKFPDNPMLETLKQKIKVK